GVSGNLAHDSHSVVEIALKLNDRGAVFESLRELAPGDLARRNEHYRAHPDARRIRGHRRRRVASRSASNRRSADPRGLSYASGHAVVFERAGRVHPLVLEAERGKLRILG